MDEVTILNEFSDREKKYFDSQEYKELLSSKGKELQRIKDPSLNLEKKKEINQADDFFKRHNKSVKDEIERVLTQIAPQGQYVCFKKKISLFVGKNFHLIINQENILHRKNFVTK